MGWDPRISHMEGLVHPISPLELLLMEEIRLNSWYGKYPIIYRVLTPSQVVQDYFHQQHVEPKYFEDLFPQKEFGSQGFSQWVPPEITGGFCWNTAPWNTAPWKTPVFWERRTITVCPNNVVCGFRVCLRVQPSRRRRRRRRWWWWWIFYFYSFHQSQRLESSPLRCIRLLLNFLILLRGSDADW